MGLATPKTVEKLQRSLHAKAKTEPGFRFYSLWDKVCRADVLEYAWRRCRTNGGAAGVDGQTFADIDAHGLQGWLGNLQQELRGGDYRPQPLLRVWIPKQNGGQRPLGIPTVRDRVVQMAVLLVLNPIFEADLLDEQYAYRPGLDAKMAVRKVFFHLQSGQREVVDGDLSDYFGSIPHGALMKSVARRVVDGRVLSVIKAWLSVAVIERTGRTTKRTTEARDRKRGTPQGGVISPLLANLYFRRFLLGWRKFGLPLNQARVVNYADDFVICCRPGRGPEALQRARHLMERLGLTINEQKTRLVQLPDGSFDFLGYTFGRHYGRDGQAFLGTKPSKKALRRVLKTIHDETARRWLTSTAEKRVEELNASVRGWCGYFNQGPVVQQYRIVQRYMERRLRRWLMAKRKRRGTGYRQYPDEYLYGRLGLYKPVAQRRDPSRATA